MKAGSGCRSLFPLLKVRNYVSNSKPIIAYSRFPKIIKALYDPLRYRMMKINHRMVRFLTAFYKPRLKISAPDKTRDPAFAGSRVLEFSSYRVLLPGW